MKYQTEDIFKSIQTYIIDNCDKEISMIEINSSLNEYITSSVEFVKIIVDIEEHYGITFSNEELDVSNFSKIKDLVEFVQKKLEIN